MKYDILPSGSYRYRKTSKGKTYTLTFETKPSDRDVMIAFAELMQNENAKDKSSFKNKAKEYIALKSNVLSPSTIAGYEKVLRCISDNFKNKGLYEIDQVAIQKEINDYAVGHSPKTVRNLHGFISAVLTFFRPSMVISTTLPQKVKFEPYLPSDDDIKKILKASDGTDYHIAFQLGVLGMRRSEVCAATLDDIDGNFLTINKAMVYDSNNNFIIKPMTKTTEGMRKIYLPDSLVEEIKKFEKIFDKLPHNLVRVLHEHQTALGLQQFRFHDLRHYYASYCHEHGMSDADIMASGGWQSDYTMKRVYRHSMESSKQEMQKKMAASIFS